MAAIYYFSLHPIKTLEFYPHKFPPLLLRPQLASITTSLFSSAASIPCLASNNSAIIKRLNHVCYCFPKHHPLRGIIRKSEFIRFMPVLVAQADDVGK